MTDKIQATNKITQAKRLVLEASLELGGVVAVRVFPRGAGVDVPAHLRETTQERPHLVLHLGLNLPTPIHDLFFDDTCIRATLSFGGRPYLCVVPWTAVTAVVPMGDVFMIVCAPLASDVAAVGASGASGTTPVPVAVAVAKASKKPSFLSLVPEDKTEGKAS